MAIQLLTLPTLVGGTSTGYPGYVNLLKNKINELATAMSISPLSLSAALGAGSPANDFNTVVSKVNELVTSVNASTGTTWNGKPVLIICDGDSTTQGYISGAGTDPTKAWPARLGAALGGNYEVVNMALGGTDTQDMLNRAPSRIDPLLNLTKYSHCFFILHGGINDFYNPHTPPSTAEGVEERLRQNLVGRQALGFKSIACTVIGSTQPYEGTIGVLNAAIRRDYSSWGIAGLVDFRTDNVLDVPTNDGYYDSIHPNQLGQQHMAKVVRASLMPILAGLGVPVPAYLFPFEAPADTAPPTAPGTPTASNITSTGVTLTWPAATDNVGVVSYDVYEDNGTARGSSNGLSLVITNLVPTTAYTLLVKARDAAGNVGPASGTVSFTTLAAGVVVGLEPVTWIELAGGATVSGANLIAPTASTAYSSKLIGPSTAAIRGYLEITWSPEAIDAVIGLSDHSHSDNGYSDIPIGWYLQNGNQFKEYGTLVPPTGNRGIAVGQVLRVQIERDGLRYFLDGIEFAFYTCVIPSSSLQVDYFALGNSTFNNVKIYAANLLTA
jgi:hypothetical protein